MANLLKRIILSAVLFASTVLAADHQPPLTELPVMDTKLLAPEGYSAASSLAARGDFPLDIVLTIVGAFEGSTQYIIQVNEGGEMPSASRITVLRDGLRDDSVRGERWDIILERAAGSVWSIKEVRKSWRCWRGEQPNRFSSKLCP
jgi:hypothetical protein